MAAEIASEYESWLRQHVSEIVARAGFAGAQIWEVEHEQPEKRFFVIHYRAERGQIDYYLENLAPAFRADGERRFGAKARASRRVLILQNDCPGLTAEREKPQIGANHRKEITMSTQASWQRIRNEFSRLTDVEHLKNEVQRIGNELRNFDFHVVLSPSAKARVKQFERRYAELMRTMQQAQRQADREFNKIVRSVKAQRGSVIKVVAEQRAKLDSLRKQFTAGSAKMKKAGAKKTKTKTAGTKKRRK